MVYQAQNKILNADQSPVDNEMIVNEMESL